MPVGAVTVRERRADTQAVMRYLNFRFHEPKSCVGPPLSPVPAPTGIGVGLLVFHSAQLFLRTLILVPLQVRAIRPDADYIRPAIAIEVGDGAVGGGDASVIQWIFGPRLIGVCVV